MPCLQSRREAGRGAIAIRRSEQCGGVVRLLADRVFRLPFQRIRTMIGRREFTVAGLTAAALGAMQASAPAQQSGNKTPAAAGGDNDHGHSSAMASCAKACSDCQRECESCAAHCAEQLTAGKKDHAKTLATCQDCATFCVAAASIVARGGPFAALICKGCVDACALCAKECEKFPDDKHMKECAAECRKCEKACKDMVAHAGHHH